MAVSMEKEVQKEFRRRSSSVVSQPRLSAKPIDVFQRREGAIVRTDVLVFCIPVFQRRFVEIEGDTQSVSQPIESTGTTTGL